MIFSWSNQEIETQLSLNNTTLYPIEEQKILGFWFSSFLHWKRNTDEICRKAYSRVHLITKLKNIGTKGTDLINNFKMYILPLLEYCSTLWHFSLTLEQSEDLELVQSVCVRVIQGEDYDEDYDSSLSQVSLQKLSVRREAKALAFGLRCIKHPKLKNHFPPRKYNTAYTFRKKQRSSK